MDKIKELIITKSKIILVIISLLFLIPTIVFYYNSKSLYNFYFENTFFLNDFNRLIQIISFIAVIILHFIFYSIIIKNKDNLFKDMKSMYVYIFLISIIFTLIIPFLSSDPFYYLGIGRLNSTYYQNPYYVSMRDFRNNTNTQVFINDHAFLKGFFNVWSDTTVVYGPIWTIICAILAKLSFSNVDLGIYIFKIFNLIMHMINCYL